jgi:membrane-bound serine protease (ClpP class)
MNLINPFLLWLLGLILIYLEFYLPGAIMGTAGGLILVGSIILFVVEYQSPLWSILYFIAVATSVALLIKYALWHIPRAKKGRSIYSNSAQEGYQASDFDESAIGKTGIVLSDLKPGGYIQIEGKQHQAISESGYIPKGEEVVVLRGESESLIVRKKR